MSSEVKRLFDQFVHGKNINEEVLTDIIKTALMSASKRRFMSPEAVRIDFDAETGKIDAYFKKKVMVRVKNPESEISLVEAKLIKKGVKRGQMIEVRVPTEEFGRIASQTARQILMQRIRDEEREQIFNEFTEKKGQIVTGTILRQDTRRVYVEIGEVEAIMPHEEQIRSEAYNANDRMKFYIVNVKKTPRGPRIIVSRTHPGLIKGLFHLEVPEIADGTVEIKGVAREPGERTKFAVFSQDPNVDPVGACVGMRGSRVQAIVREVNGEKIDIVEWSAEMETFIRNAMSPAQLDRLIFSPEEKRVQVVAPNDQLALSIGRKGQNAKLAARLVGWRIDIKNQEDFMKEQREKAELAFRKQAKVSLEDLPGVDSELVAALKELEVEGGQALLDLGEEKLLELPGMDAEKVSIVLEGTKAALAKAEEEILEEIRLETEAKAEAEAKAKAEAKAEAENMLEAGPKDESDTEDEAKSKDETKSEAEAKSEDETKSEAEAKSDDETKSEADSRAEAEPKAEADPGTQTGSQAETQTQAESKEEAHTENQGDSPPEAPPADSDLEAQTQAHSGADDSPEKESKPGEGE